MPKSQLDYITEVLCAIRRRQVERVNDLLEKFDLEDDQRLCTRSATAKRAKNWLKLSKDTQYELLTAAVESSSPEILKLLLKKGMSVKVPGKSCPRSISLLRIATKLGSEEMVKILLESGFDVDGKQYNA